MIQFHVQEMADMTPPQFRTRISSPVDSPVLEEIQKTLRESKEAEGLQGLQQQFPDDAGILRQLGAILKFHRITSASEIASLTDVKILDIFYIYEHPKT